MWICSASSCLYLVTKLTLHELKELKSTFASQFPMLQSKGIIFIKRRSRIQFNPELTIGYSTNVNSTALDFYLVFLTVWFHHHLFIPDPP